MRRLALEADVVTDTASLLTLTFESVRENIEGRYAAIYIAAGGAANACARRGESTSGEPGTETIRRRALAPLERTIRDGLGRHPLSEALLLPMSIRGSLLGLRVCGPKRERSHYLSEEVDALALVAHRVGAAYELLSASGPRPRRDRHRDATRSDPRGAAGAGAQPT